MWNREDSTSVRDTGVLQEEPATQQQANEHEYRANDDDYDQCLAHCGVECTER